MGLRLFDGYKPKDFGLDGWEEYRRHPVTDQEVQLEAIEYFITSKKRIVAACIPPGVGKSLIAMSVLKFLEERGVILTATNGLENQYMSDMEPYGLVNIRGKNKYDCYHEDRGIREYSCLTGPQAGCRLVGGGGCHYEIERDISREADSVVTNYDYWFNINIYGGIQRVREEDIEEKGPNPIQVLFCDEAHEADKKLSDFLSIRVYEKEVQHDVDTKTFGENVKEWRSLAVRRYAETKEELEGLDQELAHYQSIGKLESKHVKAYHEVKKLNAKFEKLSTIADDWVIEKRYGAEWGRSWAFDVKWPGRYHHYLFNSVPKIFMMSATLKPHHLRRLGVAKDDYEFREWERIFPRNRCPIYYLPARSDEGKDVRITQKSGNDALQAWVDHIDDMMESRIDRRIVLITTSYKYQKLFLERSRHRDHIIANNSDDPDTPTSTIAFNKFIESKPPTILCSPSFGTGWDFKYDRCEFLIISKVPLKPPPNTSKLAQARFDQDGEYFDQETMSDIEQIAGRPQRADDDRGEVVIADGTWAWWGHQNKHLGGKGFVDGVRKVAQLPKAPERLYKP